MVLYNVVVYAFPIHFTVFTERFESSLRCRRPLSIDWVLRASAQIHRISCSIRYVKYAHKILLCKLFSLIMYILASHISCRVRYVIF